MILLNSLINSVKRLQHRPSAPSRLSSETGLLLYISALICLISLLNLTVPPILMREASPSGGAFFYLTGSEAPCKTSPFWQRPAVTEAMEVQYGARYSSNHSGDLSDPHGVSTPQQSRRPIMIAPTTPSEKLSGKEFEALVAWRAERDFARAKDKDIFYTLSRSGVKGRFNSEDSSWRPMASLPDFEGVTKHPWFGRQFVFDCKVTSSASWSMVSGSGSSKGFRRSQYPHLALRGGMGAIAFVLIHFNERQLKSKTEPAVTFAVPVMRHTRPLWNSYEAGDIKSLSRTDCYDHGILVVWNDSEGAYSKMTPDIGAAILDMGSV